MKRLFAIFVALVATMVAMAQTPVKVSNEVVDFNGKRCYVHVLQKGQTIHSVSQAYGNKDYEAIARKEIHSLHVGDTIWLPCKNPNQPLTSELKAQEPRSETPSNYIKVEPGQTLYGISKAYGVSVEDIKALNPEVAESGLKAGQMLRLPSGKADKPAAAAVEPIQSSAPAVAPAQVRARVDKNKVYVSLMMPLNLDKMGEISTTKFDVEQRGKKSYRSLEFIQFYEGAEMALKELESRGVDIVLNVVDVPGMAAADAEKAYTSHNVANSDLLIALLTKDGFAKVAELAQRDHLFVVNPMSTRTDIVENPYVVKIMPSVAGQSKAIVQSIRASYPGYAVTVVCSGHKNEQPIRDELQQQFSQAGMTVDFFTWSNDSKLLAALKRNPHNVVVNIYDQDRSRNRVQSSTLMNRLVSIKTNTPILYTIPDYTKEYSDIDFGQLQQLSYHTFNTDYDENVPSQKQFVEAYREQYKTEPIGQYAALGHDVALYFINGLNEKGSDFWKSPVVANLQSMLQPIRLSQSQPGRGFENQTAEVRALGNYRFESASSTTTKK